MAASADAIGAFPDGMATVADAIGALTDWENRFRPGLPPGYHGRGFVMTNGDVVLGELLECGAGEEEEALALIGEALPQLDAFDASSWLRPSGHADEHYVRLYEVPSRHVPDSPDRSSPGGPGQRAERR